MTTPLASARAVTDGVLAALDAAGLLVGDATAPAAGGWQGAAGQSQFTPYVVVHPLPGGRLAGTIAHPNETAKLVFQVTAWGSTREQAEWAADGARSALLASGAVTEAGRSVFSVTVELLAGCWLDDTVRPALHRTGDRFAVTTVPA